MEREQEAVGAGHGPDWSNRGRAPRPALRTAAVPTRGQSGRHRHRPRLAALTPSTLAIVLLAAFFAPSAQADFGFKSLALTFTNEDASPATQAGSHPFAWTTTVLFNATGALGEELPDGDLKDLRFRLPAGLVGTPSLLPRCSHADFLLNQCSDAEALGTIGIRTDADLAGTPAALVVQAPVYNLMPLAGNGAELAVYPAVFEISIPLTIPLRLESAPPHALLASMTNLGQTLPVLGYQLTLWGDPADPAHDPYRGQCAATTAAAPAGDFALYSLGNCPAAVPIRPFFTLPASCTQPSVTFEADSWQEPGVWARRSLTQPLLLSDCGALSFSPSISARPTTASAHSPSGLDLSLEAPDEGITSPAGTAAADLASAALSFPPEMTINPALAAGLAACSPAELARETPGSVPGEGCPQAAKIGTAEATTPLVEHPIAGNVFVAQPDDPATTTPGAENPFDARFALYLVLRDPARGILVTIPIRIEPDPETGRLSATLDQIPQLPLSHVGLRFNSGPHAPLTTPACGTHTIASSLMPSSGAAPLPGATAFATDRDCPTPAFTPDLSAGTTSNAAGRASPFIFDLSTHPGEPNPAGLSLSLPPGLSAAFASAAICPDPLVASANCPPDSRLGYARIALGPGPEPLWIPEAGRSPSDVYLAGPYRGTPYSLLIVVPAEAGPFDLGTVALRAAIAIDPTTTQASVQLDQLPQILAGVPLDYRTIRLILDRPGFTRNPTSCEPTEISATATSAAGISATLHDRFQAADCAALQLEPHLALRLSGGLGRNAHPTVTVDVAPRAADANLSAANLSLPHGIFFDPARLRESCTRQRFAAAACPPGARLGWLEIQSPLIAQPERGRLYLLEGDKRLPDLAAALAGPVALELHGQLSTPHGRIRASFDSLPDLPLSRLRLVLKGGFRGLLVNSEGLCSHSQLAGASFAGHNGRRRLLRPRAATPCGRAAPGQRRRGARR
jgi:hypothetical protein